MKAKKLLSKILPLAMLLALIMIVTFSCRKKDTEYTPVQPVPNPRPATPDVFSNRPLHLMTNSEVANHVMFPGHLLNRIGHGLKGDDDPLDPFADVGTILKSFVNFAKTEKTNMNFSKIEGSLGQIIGQNTVLQNGIDSISHDLQLMSTGFAAFMKNLDAQTLITNITETYDSATSGGLTYYAVEGRKYNANPESMQSQMHEDTINAVKYANAVYPSGQGGPKDAVNNINQLSTLFLSHSNTSTALYNYTRLVILAVGANTAQYADSSSMMNLYKLVENYFLQVVNCEFQAAACYMNAANAIDTNGYEAKSYYTGQFSQIINAEVQEFLKNVDYLTINLGEYRDSTRFNYDMQFASAGIAPDITNYNVLARAQFVANLLCDAVGIPTSVICGHILVPKLYEGNNWSTTPPQIQIVVGGSILLSSSDTTMESQMPYTYWSLNGSNNSQCTCTPDNNWNLYRFLSGNNAFPATKTQIILGNLENQGSPWLHYVQIQGYVTPLYYNPQNPNQTSTTPTTTCTFEFAYFSATWQWGYLYLTNSSIVDGSGWVKTGPKYCFNFQPFNTTVSGLAQTVPFVATTSGSYNNLKIIPGISSFTYPNNTAGTMSFSGSTTFTKNYYIVADNYWNTVTTASSFPNNLTLNAWAAYTGYYSMGNSVGADLTVNIGTNLLVDFTGEWGCVGSDVVGQNYHNKVGQTISGWGKSKSLLAAGTTYKPGVQYYYQTYNLPDVTTAGITLTTACQFVFNGYYPLP